MNGRLEGLVQYRWTRRALLVLIPAAAAALAFQINQVLAYVAIVVGVVLITHALLFVEVVDASRRTSLPWIAKWVAGANCCAFIVLEFGAVKRWLVTDNFVWSLETSVLTGCAASLFGAVRHYESKDERWFDKYIWVTWGVVSVCDTVLMASAMTVFRLWIG
jgi:hypothetical protein